MIHHPHNPTEQVLGRKNDEHKARLVFTLALQVVSEHNHVHYDDLLKNIKAGRSFVKSSRAQACYLTVTEGNVSSSNVARIVGVSRHAVSQSLRALEDARDNPKIDSIMDTLSEVLRMRLDKFSSNVRAQLCNQ